MDSWSSVRIDAMKRGRERPIGRRSRIRGRISGKYGVNVDGGGALKAVICFVSADSVDDTVVDMLAAVADRGRTDTVDVDGEW